MNNPVLLSAENSIIEKGVLKKYTGTDTSVRIPDDVHTINASAFRKACPIAHMALGKAVKKIKGLPPQLASFAVDEENPHYAAIDGVLYDKKIETIIRYPVAKTDSTYIVPDGVKGIIEEGCYGALYLEQVIFPESFEYAEPYAFSSCSKLKSVRLPKGYKEIARGMFNGTGLQGIQLPEGITSIGQWAFSKTHIEQITIPDSVANIEPGAFQECNNLKKVVLSASITAIPDKCFSDCCSLSSIVTPSNDRSLGDSAFSETHTEQITIPDSVANIGSRAFKNCSNLKKVVLSASITTIPDHCFDGCCSLSSIVIPPNVRSLGSGAFSETGIETIDIPHGIEVIPRSCFSCCKNLKSISIPDSVHTIENWAFTSCRQLRVVLPESIKDVYGDIFGDCQYVEYGNNAAAIQAKAEHDEREAKYEKKHQEFQAWLEESREYRENTINRHRKLAKEIVAHRQEFKGKRDALNKEITQLKAEVAQQQKIIQECGVAIWGEKARRRKQAKEIAESKKTQLDNLLRNRRGSLLAEHKITENPICIYSNCGHTVKLYQANGLDATFAFEVDGTIVIFNACEVELVSGSHDYKTDASELDKAIMIGLAAGSFAGYVATSAATVYTVIEDLSISILNKETRNITKIVFASDIKLTRAQFEVVVNDLNRMMNSLIQMLDNLDPYEIAAHELIKSGNLD